MAKRAVRQTPAAPVGRPPVFDFERGRQDFKKSDYFFRFVREYPDQTGLCVYVYRVAPRINLRLVGAQQNHIEKIVDFAELGVDYMRNRWGSGVYKLKLSDSNSKPNDRAQTVFEIDDPEVEPILDPASLVLEEPKNLSYVNSLVASGVLVRSEDGQVRLKGQAGNAPAAATVVEMPKPVAVPVAPVLAPAVVHQASNLDLQPIVLEMLKRAFPPAQQPVSEQAMIENAFRIADRLAPPAKSNSDSDPLEVYERVARLVDRALNRNGSAADVPALPAGPPPESGVGQFLDGLARLLSQAPAMVQAYSMLRQMQPPQGPPPGARVPAAAVSMPFIQAMPGPLPAGVPAAAPSTVEPLAEEEQAMMSMFHPGMIDRLQRIGALAVEKFDEGVSGYDFAQGLCCFESHGKQVFRMLDSMGPQNLLNAISAVPAVRVLVLSRRPELEAWLEDFLTFDPDAPADSDEEMNESAGSAGAP